MRKILSILFLLFGLTSFGQKVKIDTLRIPVNKEFQSVETDDLKFPIIKTGSRVIDSLINYDVRNTFSDGEFAENPVDSTLINWAEQIIYMDFEVTYNQNGMLSFNISAEGCGAHCTSWTDYFNYSVFTGKSLAIEDIIENPSDFKKRVISDKDKRYDTERQELKKLLLDKESGLDKETYEWALESYNECDKSFELKSFALYPDYIMIAEWCHLPNAIKNLDIPMELKYHYSKIKGIKIKPFRH